MAESGKQVVLIAAGGTGGHVIPALEVAKALRDSGWTCVFVGTDRGFENRLVPAQGFALRHVPIGSLNRASVRQRLVTLLLAPCALLVMLALMRRWSPAVALSLGGYSSGPLVAACALLDVPLVLLEPNATPGLANRLAAPAARLALLCHPQAAAFFRPTACTVTGLPVRREFFEVAPRQPGQPFTVLILGGSQGAKRLNEAAVDAVRAWQRDGVRPPRLIHQTGGFWHEEVAKAYQELGIEAETAPFFDDMPARFAQADLVICRAGASVLAELCAARKPAVLVPFPYATDDHQRANAAVLARAGGALLIDDSDWTGERMAGEIKALLSLPETLDRMAAALGPLAPVGAAQRAAAAVAEAAKRWGKDL